MGGITYSLYESTQKKYENLRGAKLLDINDNPFLDGPCFLSIAAAIMTSSINFGVAKQALQTARIRIRNYPNAKFNVDDVPIRFLSLHYSYCVNSNYTYDGITEKFALDKFLPLVSKNGKKIDVVQAMKNMRNVNILTYCNATNYFKQMENALSLEMQKLGYTEEEQSKILSQICVFPVATYSLDGSEKATIIGFRDINDPVVKNPNDSIHNPNVKESEIGEYLAKYSDNVYEYLVDGNGIHFKSLAKYSKTGFALPVILATAVTTALQNSIYNSTTNNTFVPISAKYISNSFYDIVKRIKTGESKELLMQELDKSLSYNNCRRMSIKEIKILDNIDIICDKLLQLEDISPETPQDKANLLESKMEISKELSELLSLLSIEKQI